MNDPLELLRELGRRAEEVACASPAGVRREHRLCPARIKLALVAILIHRFGVVGLLGHTPLRQDWLLEN